MQNLGTGLQGFIGSHLAKRIKITDVPHDKITETTIKLFDKFFFLSTYGNLADQTDDDKILKANITDLVHVLLQSDLKFKSFIFTSSSSVQLKVQTMYSRTKKAAEQILLAFKEKYHVPICIIRPFSVTGVGEQPQHLIPTLIKACLTGETINLVPNATHDYIDVDDVVEGIINLSENQAGGVYELGTGRQYTNLEVLKIVEQVTGKKAKINIVNSMRSYDNQEWVCTNFRARSYGWQPKKSLEDSIKEMYEAYK